MVQIEQKTGLLLGTLRYVGIHKNFHTASYIEIEEIGRENNFRKDLKKLNLVYFGQATK